MTSACIFKDTLRNDTQVFLKFRDSVFEICSQLELHFLLLTFIDAEQRSGNITGNPASQKWTIINRNTDHSLIFIISQIQLFDQEFIQFPFLKPTNHPTLQSFRRILMCSLWSRYPMSPVRSGTTLRIC